jgi:hypothetical protein
VDPIEPPINIPAGWRVITYAKNQPPYRPLPVLLSDADEEGRRITCWRLTWRERLRLLVTGQIWLHQLTFVTPINKQVPVLLDTNPPQFETQEPV